MIKASLIASEWGLPFAFSIGGKEAYYHFAFSIGPFHLYVPKKEASDDE